MVVKAWICIVIVVGNECGVPPRRDRRGALMVGARRAERCGLADKSWFRSSTLALLKVLLENAQLRRTLAILHQHRPEQQFGWCTAAGNSVNVTSCCDPLSHRRADWLVWSHRLENLEKLGWYFPGGKKTIRFYVFDTSRSDSLSHRGAD